MSRVCVFCGSHSGNDPAFVAAARETAEALHERGLGLVYGGGAVGLMADLADAFIALPGGWGTLEEFVEVLTWAQLGLHSKPLGVVSVGGYFDPLAAFRDGALASGFVLERHASLIRVGETPAELLDLLDILGP